MNKTMEIMVQPCARGAAPKTQCASPKDRLACRAASRGSLFGSV